MSNIGCAVHTLDLLIYKFVKRKILPKNLEIGISNLESC